MRSTEGKPKGGKFFGEREEAGGPENITDIDSNRLGLNSKVQERPMGFLDLRRHCTSFCSSRSCRICNTKGARHYKNIRGEISNKVSNISSSRNGWAGRPH